MKKHIAAVAKLLPLILLTALPGATISGCTRDEKAPVDIPVSESTKLPAVVSTELVEKQIPPSDSRYSAVVQPSEELTVAFKVTGYVQSIYKVRGIDGRWRPVQNGDFVSRGTVLGRIEQSDDVAKVNEQNAGLAEAKLSETRSIAALKEAEVSLAQSRQEFERVARLYEKESVTKPDYESAKTRLEVAQTRVEGAKAQIESSRTAQDRAKSLIEQAKTNVRDCTVTAPISGIVLKRFIEEGSLASQGAPAFTLANADQVKVAFGVPDVELHNLNLGQTMSVTTEAVPHKVFEGKVSEIAGAADPKTRVFNVEVSLSNRTHELRPGMVASLVLKKQATAGLHDLSIPMTAVVRSSQRSDGYAVFVVEDRAGKLVATERQVELGEASGRLVEVLSGVQPGERVVTSGSTRIASGQEVKLNNENL